VSKELKGFRNVDTNEEWMEMAKAYDYKCFYCDLDFLESPFNFSCAEVDHFKPRSIDGVEGEVVPACRFCNKVKRNKQFATVEEAIAGVKRLQEEYLAKYRYAELRREHRGSA